MTDSELARCSSLISHEADLSVLISHLGIPVEAQEGLSKQALSLLKWWQHHHGTEASRHKLADILQSCGQGFEQAAA